MKSEDIIFSDLSFFNSLLRNLLARKSGRQSLLFLLSSNSNTQVLPPALWQTTCYGLSFLSTPIIRSLWRTWWHTQFFSPPPWTLSASHLHPLVSAPNTNNIFYQGLLVATHGRISEAYIQPPYSSKNHREQQKPRNRTPTQQTKNQASTCRITIIQTQVYTHQYKNTNH